MNDELLKIIHELKAQSSLLQYDEATTKQVIILRLLSGLGWNVFAADEVQPEYQVQNGRVDYALRYGSKNKVFLEVKKPSEPLEGHDRQLLDYSFKEGVKLAILSNGLSWWFYLPLFEGNWDQRKFFAIDLFQQNEQDVVERFIDYLSIENVKSGKSLSLAEQTHKGRVRLEEIKRHLPIAWNRIITEPDGLLVDLINDTLEKVSGFRAEEKQIHEFISTYISPHQESHSTTELDRPSKIYVKQPVTDKASYSNELPPDGTRCRFEYKGKMHSGLIRNRLICIDGVGKYETFSAASYALTDTSRNGWRDWELLLPNTESWTMAFLWREQKTLSR